MDKAALEQHLALLKSEIERPVSSDVIIDVQDKLSKLLVLMGLSAECMKHARKMVLDKQRVCFAMAGKHGHTPSTFKLWLDGEMAEELALFTYCERLNAAIVHACDGLRTLISLYKSEISNFKN